MKLVWKWIGLLLVFVPWAVIFAGAEFVMHLLRIPHWH